MRHFVLAALLLAGPSIFASEEELTLRVQKLETLIEELRTKADEPAPVLTAPAVAPAPKSPSFEILRDADQLRTQLGPAASKIYFHPESTWQTGLSSELFTFQQGPVNRANVMSVAPVLSFRPHKRLIFNAQFLFENGGSESRDTVAYQKGQSIVQMAYLDWLTDEKGRSGLRVGHQLVPIGMINTQSEPVSYFSVLRPELERELIPASWHENGLSFWVDRPRADLQIGIFNSLDARGFRHDTLFAGGRAQGQNAAASDLMGVLRVNAKNGIFLLGASFVAGNTAQEDPAIRNGGFRIGEIHARVRGSRFEISGMVAQAQLDDAEAISIYNANAMPSLAYGNSVQAAYDVIGGKQKLWMFVRQSNYNLNARMPQGLVADRALEKTATVFGTSYFPTVNLVIKADYSIKRNAANQKDDVLALGLGVVF